MSISKTEDREAEMAKNPKCQGTTTSVECSDYVDNFKVTRRWGGTRRTTTECLSHAADAESRGVQVELIDKRRGR
jgi:hypothetical protein